MSTAAADHGEPPPRPATGSKVGPRRWRLLARIPLGPALIILSVLFLFRDYAFRGLVTSQHGDILQQWLPFFCHLGGTLRSGHIPTFNPYMMGGVPFGADPQTGWMYLPAMLLFTILPCALAIRWFIVIQPILAGLGVYWFLRGEGTNRPAATAGGLVLALMMADSHIGLELPFAGTLAWTSLSLAAAGRFTRAQRITPRVAWLALMALAWGQIAAAHLSHGLVIGTGLLIFYLAYRSVALVRSGASGALFASGLFVLALAALPMVNLAGLLPRLAYLPHTTLGLGYKKLSELDAQVSGRPLRPVLRESARFDWYWILGLASSPGAYLGAVAMALSFAGLWLKRLRGLTITLLVFGALSYLLSLPALATRLSPHIESLPFADFYVHVPARFRYGVVAVLPLLVGLGVHAWCHGGSWRRRIAMLVPGVALWWVWNGVVGRPFTFPKLLILGSVLAAAALVATAWRPSLAWILPGVVLVELLANGIIGASLPPRHTGSPWSPSLPPMISAADYMREGGLARRISSGDGRYVTLSPKGQNVPGRRVLLVNRGDWSALGDDRGTLFGLQDAGGYNPTQLVRYWEFIRAVDDRRVTYNAGFLTRPPSVLALDLLQVRWLVAPSDIGPGAPDAKLVAQENGWGLYDWQLVPSRATLLGSWQVVQSAGAALRQVTASGFDPTARVILEQDPGLATPGVPVQDVGTAIYRDDGPGAATVTVDANAPAVVLVRNPFGAGWHATVDGRSTPLLAADFVDQGVAVSAGRHVIRLVYSDPSIGYGFAGTVVVLLVMIGVALVGTVRTTSRRPTHELQLDPLV